MRTTLGALREGGLRAALGHIVLAFVVLCLLAGCSSDVPEALERAPVEPAPSGLSEKIDALARSMGDADAEVWWAKTTGAVIDPYLQQERDEEWESDRPVYVVVLHGEFSELAGDPELGLPGYPPGAEGPYTWILLTMGGASPTYPIDSLQADYEPFPDGLPLAKAER